MNRVALSVLLAAALALTACQNKTELTAARVDEPYTPFEETSAEPAPAALPADPYADYATAYQPPADRSEPAFRAEPIANDEILAPASEQSYTVKKGDTLYALARRFYGDQSRWKDIWDANRAQIKNPDKLYVGTKLNIP